MRNPTIAYIGCFILFYFKYYLFPDPVWYIDQRIFKIPTHAYRRHESGCCGCRHMRACARRTPSMTTAFVCLPTGLDVPCSLPCPAPACWTSRSRRPLARRRSRSQTSERSARTRWCGRRAARWRRARRTEQVKAEDTKALTAVVTDLGEGDGDGGGNENRK